MSTGKWRVESRKWMTDGIAAAGGGGLAMTNGASTPNFCPTGVCRFFSLVAEVPGRCPIGVEDMVQDDRGK